MKSQTTQIRCWLVLFSLAASLQITLGYYDPAAQRWINRDPLGELGGDNLFRALGNAPVSRHDAAGLLTDECIINRAEHGWPVPGPCSRPECKIACSSIALVINNWVCDFIKEPRFKALCKTTVGFAYILCWVRCEQCELP